MGVYMSYSFKVLYVLLSIYQYSKNSLKRREKMLSRDLLIVPLSIAKHVGRDSSHVQSGLFLL